MSDFNDKTQIITRCYCITSTYIDECSNNKGYFKQANFGLKIYYIMFELISNLYYIPPFQIRNKYIY